MMNWDFKRGDEVFHKSNIQIRMVVINTDNSNGTIICKWVENSGKQIESDFYPEELRKSEVGWSIKGFAVV